MKIKTLPTDVCVYDGVEPALINADLNHIKLGQLSFSPSELRPIVEINQADSSLAPDDVVRSLNTETTQLGSLSIYKGTARGSKLYFLIRDEIIFIVSYGESQPARFECEINAYITA
jgi:hypothetical protein